MAAQRGLQHSHAYSNDPPRPRRRRHSPDVDRSPFPNTVQSNTDRGRPRWFRDHFTARDWVQPPVG